MTDAVTSPHKAPGKGLVDLAKSSQYVIKILAEMKGRTQRFQPQTGIPRRNTDRHVNEPPKVPLK
jgi:hypothetical protein